jgi:hypothetical protein
MSKTEVTMRFEYRETGTTKPTRGNSLRSISSNYRISSLYNKRKRAMITFHKTIKSAMKVSGVALTLYAGTQVVCALTGYSSVAQALADVVMAAAIFGGSAYEVKDNRKVSEMTISHVGHR